MATVYRGTGRVLARHVAVQAALAAAAEDVAQRAKVIAAEHTDSGDYAASIHTTRDGTDQLVVTDDPDALSKEFGRTGARGRGTSRGVYALTRAAAGEGG